MNGIPDQSIGNTFHMPPYIRGSSYNGAMSKDEDTESSSMQSDNMLNDFKNALRIISSDVSSNKQHRNGDNGILNIFTLKHTSFCIVHIKYIGIFVQLIYL